MTHKDRRDAAVDRPDVRPCPDPMAWPTEQIKQLEAEVAALLGEREGYLHRIDSLVCRGDELEQRAERAEAALRKLRTRLDALKAE